MWDLGMGLILIILVCSVIGIIEAWLSTLMGAAKYPGSAAQLNAQIRMDLCFKIAVVCMVLGILIIMFNPSSYPGR